MANDKETTEVVKVSDLRGLIDAMNDNAAAVRDAAPAKRVPWSKRDPQTPFAEGKKRRERAKLKYTFYQNGFRPLVKNLFDREVALINQLTPGKYINNLVTVRRVESGNADPDAIHINYPNKTVDQRLALNQEVKGLLGMLQRCVDEAAANAATQQRKNVA